MTDQTATLTQDGDVSIITISIKKIIIEKNKKI